MALPFGLKHHHLGPIAVGAAAGAIASAAALMAYVLLASKGLAGSLATKAALSAKTAGTAGTTSSGQNLLDLLVSGGVGGIGGGITGASMARNLVHQSIEPLRQRVDTIAGQLLNTSNEPSVTPSDTTSETDVDPAEDADTLVASNSELQRIIGIGPKFAKKLSQGGITSIAELAQAEAQAVCDLVTNSAAGVSISQAESWIDQAIDLINDEIGDDQ